MADEMKAYAACVLVHNPPKVGYRMMLVAARSMDEAIGIAVRKVEENEPPGAAVSSPTALVINAETLGRIGISPHPTVQEGP